MMGCTALVLLLALGQSLAVPPRSSSSQTPPECGSSNPNGNTIDQSEPAQPGPFHDLTTNELKKLREFLEKDPKIRAVKSSNASIDSSYIFTAELLLPRKDQTVNYLDRKGPQPMRQAHVIMFRGDKSPPVVEEYVCTPLPNIDNCELLNRTTKRNPVEFSVRPLNGMELKAIRDVVLKKVDEKVGDILMESYGGKFTEGKKEDQLDCSPSVVGTGLVGDINKRLMWITAMFKLQHKSLHALDFAVLLDLNSTQPEDWSVQKVWYSNQLFDSMDELADSYRNNSISKTKVTKPKDDESLFSSLRRRGDPQPPQPQRPPRLVEPDGKRYSVKDKKVEYMGWSFNYRLSPLTGPAILDVKFKGERIVYELSLNDIAVFHSGFAPSTQTLDEVDSSVMLGSRSKALIPGAGCPETSTLLNAVFMNQYQEEPAVFEGAFCLFENNIGSPLRRHLSYTIQEGAFYGGMLDSALTLRSTITYLNYDYIIDYILHQNGVIETKVMSTGYVHTTFVSSEEKKYGHQIQDNIVGNVHQHLVNFKVDLDINGRSNRFETLDISEEKLMLTAFPDKPYSQSKINSTLKKTEKEGVVDSDFSTAKYYIVHNNDRKNKYNESKAYRIEMKGISKNLLEESMGNEKSISWARHQMVVTKRKEDEATSSSIYSMLDSHEPVSKFDEFYADDENIADEDLVVWLTNSLQHIPHSEDLPNTAAVGNHLSFFLMPHNYFAEDPSIASRDAIYIEHKDPKDPSKGVKVERNGNSRDQCVVPKSTLEEDLEANPDRILESRRQNPTDF